MGPPSSPSAQRRRFRRRRWVAALIAVALIGSLVGGLVTAIRSMVDAERTTPPVQAVVTPPTTTSPATTLPPTTAAPAGTAAVDAPGPTPSAADPARVLVAGDSDAGAFGPPLLELLGATGVVAPTLDYKVSSGLSRPDFFDWPARFRQQIADLDPHLVVVTFGGNDAQDLSVDGRAVPVSDPAWTTAYRARVRAVLDLLTDAGRHVVWVGIPNAESEAFTARLVVQRDAVVAELAAHPAADRVHYVDTWARFAGRSGGYADYIVDPRDGVGKKVRAPDGFHLNVAGAEILARDIAAVVTAALGLAQTP